MAAQSSEESRRPLVVVANRLPVTEHDGQWRPSAGGLVTALRPVVEQRGGDWIGWDGGSEEVPRRVPGLNVDLHPVTLSRAEVEGYYYGFANRTLWPLFHDLVEEPVIDRGWWATYHDVNHRFGAALAELDDDPDGPDPVFWIQDYHLLLLPELVRRQRPGSRIGHFLHTPFPPPELTARLPWREELLRGLLAADALGFHTERYRSNFVRSVDWILDDVDVEEDDGVVTQPDDHRTITAADAISIDAADFADMATSEETSRELQTLRERFEDRRVFLGVDRLDYTKGVRHRLQAIERLLDRNEALRRRFIFIQVAVPSRDDIEEYQQLREEVEREVGRINGRFTEPGGDVPVHYLYRELAKPHLAAYYRLADVMAVTPLKDGMNLVAKEFATCQAAGGEAGVLLLSEFTGAALELGDHAVTCNPFDVEGLAELMERCLQMDEADRRRRIEAMADHVRANDVFHWVDEQLAAIEAGGRA